MMVFFLNGHFEFFLSKIFFLMFISNEKNLGFHMNYHFFCTMNGFFRILEKRLSELICTRQYVFTLYFYNNEPSKNKHFLILLSSLARNSQEPKLKRIFEIL